MANTKQPCEDFGLAMKHLDKAHPHCTGCTGFHKCLALSSLRVLVDLHQMIGVVMVNAGMAQSVDEKGRPVTPRKIVAAGGPLPTRGPLSPV